MVGGVDAGAQRSLVSCSKPVAGSHAAGNSHFQKAQILQLKTKKSEISKLRKEYSMSSCVMDQALHIHSSFFPV
jgi:hypothetical protein